jgi:hypothetical protein
MKASDDQRLINHINHSTQAERRVRFSQAEVDEANEQWGFNCGPGAICAALDMTPAELRPHLLGFEAKRYTNPSLMTAILRALGVSFRVAYRSDHPLLVPDLGIRPGLGLVRVQWGGPWTKPGVPMRVRYRHTHWAATAGGQVFDVNAMSAGGWVSWEVWTRKLLPWLIPQCCPDGDGTWWPTHVLEVTPKGPESL